MKETKAIILAAGKGTRMKSKIPKVLNLIAGKPIIEWIVESLENVNVSEIILIVNEKNIEPIKEVLKDRCTYVIQKNPLGTAHAVLQAEEKLSDFDGNTFVMVGDAPGIESGDLRILQETHEKHENLCTFLTVEIPDKKPPWGRIIKDSSGKVLKIVEEKDASKEELLINEISSSHFIFDNKKLFEGLHEIGNDNASKEFYLSDIIEVLAKKGKVETIIIDDILRVYGTNTKDELERINRYFAEER